MPGWLTDQKLTRNSARPLPQRDRATHYASKFVLSFIIGDFRPISRYISKTVQDSNAATRCLFLVFPYCANCARVLDRKQRHVIAHGLCGVRSKKINNGISTTAVGCSRLYFSRLVGVTLPFPVKNLLPAMRPRQLVKVCVT